MSSHPNQQIFNGLYPFFLVNGKDWCPEEWNAWRAVIDGKGIKKSSFDGLRLMEDQEVLNLSRAKNCLAFEQLKLDRSQTVEDLERAAVHAFALKFSLAVFEDRIRSD